MKILIICSAGMSSSLIANKMQQELQKMGIEGVVDAFSSSEMISRMDDYDIVLVGPQLRYMYAEIADTCAKAGKTALLIDMKAYGKQDAAAIIKQVQEALSK